MKGNTGWSKNYGNTYFLCHKKTVNVICMIMLRIHVLCFMEICSACANILRVAFYSAFVQIQCLQYSLFSSSVIAVANFSGVKIPSSRDMANVLARTPTTPDGNTKVKLNFKK